MISLESLEALRSAVTLADLPPSMKTWSFGVEYVPVALADGAELYLTRYGWPWRRHLMPEQWCPDGAVARRGVRLARSSGSVFRVGTRVDGRDLELVAKVSRVGQQLDDGSLTLPSSSAWVPEFHCPFQEFGAVERLRQSPLRPRIHTKRPLAVFSPGERFQAWQLGRQAGGLSRQIARHRADPSRRPDLPHRVELDTARRYLVVYAWIEGLTLPELLHRGSIDDASLRHIARDARDDLGAHGFCTLDHKPDHVIVRPRRDARLPFRGGHLVYALADYELLFELRELAQ